MRYVSTFSGIEAASVAFRPLGWEALAFSEVEPFPCAVLAHRFPEVPNLGDIREVDWSGYRGAADLVCGGSPCQSFSVAGGRTGLDGESRLMFEFIRCVADVRPRWFMWENVPGVFGIDSGRAFGILLDEMVQLGYGLAWRTLDAQFFGVAQRRRRVFLVGHTGAAVGRAAAVLFDRESVSGNTRTGWQKRAELAADAGRGAQGSDCIGIQGDGDTGVVCMADDAANAAVDADMCGSLKCGGATPAVAGFSQKVGSRARGIGWEPGCAPCLSAERHDAAMTDGLTVRRLTPLECERLQGFPDGWTDVPYRGSPHPPDSPRYRALGNSWAVPCARWIAERMDYVDGLEAT